MCMPCDLWSAAHFLVSGAERRITLFWARLLTHGCSHTLMKADVHKMTPAHRVQSEGQQMLQTGKEYDFTLLCLSFQKQGIWLGTWKISFSLFVFIWLYGIFPMKDSWRGRQEAASGTGGMASSFNILQRAQGGTHIKGSTAAALQNSWCLAWH